MPGQLFLHDEVVQRAGAAPAVLGRPGHTDEASCRELGLPRAQVRDLFTEVVEPWREPLAVLPRQVLVQPGATLGAELVLFGCGRQVHEGPDRMLTLVSGPFSELERVWISS